MSQLEPLLGQTEKSSSKGTVVIGTVKNDIHDIGKNIVVDLGVDVPAEQFVRAAEK